MRSTVAAGDVLAVYGSGVLAGILFGTLPALSSELTSPNAFALTPTSYGLLFGPQAVGAIGGAWFAGVQIRRVGHQRLLLASIALSALSVLVLASVQLLERDSSSAYIVLLVAACLLGLSFGIAVPLLMTIAGNMFPERRDRAVLYMNALFALGPALAPLIAGAAIALGAWWLMPLTILIVLAADMVFSHSRALTLPGDVGRPATTTTVRATAESRASLGGLPRRLWLYIAFSFLYGIVQTLNGNWSALFMTEDIGASDAQGALAITAFWLMVAVGRVVFGSIDHIVPEVVSYRALSFLTAAALILLSQVPDGDVMVALISFGLVGLAASVALPLSSSFGQQELASYRRIVSNAVFISLMLGYMLASFAVGPTVEHAGIDPGLIYVAAAVAALAMGAISIPIVRGYRAAVATSGAAR